MAFNLNQMSSLSVQEMIRDGAPHDLYYYDHTNLFVQSKPTLTNNKFVQSFVSYNGTNQLIFSPDEGLTDVICNFVLASQNQLASQSATYALYGLNRGWGYALVNQIAVRYGGSSQYFWTGEQMLMENCIDMQDAVSRDFLYALGGQALLSADFTGNPTVQYPASIYINLPHNTPNGDGLKMNPLPTELLRQPVLIQVTLNNPQSIFSKVTTGQAILAVNPLVSAQFQVKQVRMINSSDLLTAHGDPSQIAYTLPLKYFAQQEYTQTIPAGTTNASINLTGFRNGGVRSIVLWLTDNAQTNYSGGGTVNNWFSWQVPSTMTLSINGEIFYTSSTSYNQLLLDLVSNKQPNQLSITQLQVTGGALAPVTSVSGSTGGVASTPTGQYVKVDFSQVNDAVFGVNMLVAGKSITNSVVNITNLNVPNTGSTYTLHALYLYNSSLVFSGGNCEYVF